MARTTTKNTTEPATILVAVTGFVTADHVAVQPGERRRATDPVVAANPAMFLPDGAGPGEQAERLHELWPLSSDLMRTTTR